MGYGYYGDFYAEPYVDSGLETFGSAIAGVGGFLLVFLAVFYFLIFAFGVACYILSALGMYRIASRRGIKNPWLSWLPVGDAWILGSISDQYQYVAKGKIKNRRKILLGLAIGALAVAIPWVISYISWIVSAVMMETGDFGAFGATLAVMLLLSLVISVVGIVNTVMQYICLYDLYTSCKPDNAVVFLILSIFINVTMPFLIFSQRNNDLGMPPRKEPEILEEVVAEEVTDEDFA